MATNIKKRKPDQESDLFEPSKPAAISYIPKHDADDDSDEAEESSPEGVLKLLEPLTKEQLISLLRSAALAHPPTLAAIRSAADLDPSLRKIFVHGLAFDSTADSLRLAFAPFGPIDDVRIVTDKISGRSKGYGFILFRNRKSAKKALKQPQKLIDGRMTACQLASVGPPSGTNPNTNPNHHHGAANQSDNLPRKVFVGNVHQDIDPTRLRAFFAQFGEIEEGPLGFDRVTGKPKGFALFVYKTLEGARKALEEPSKNFEGNMLVCQRASDNSNKGVRGTMGALQNPGQNPNFGGHNPNANAVVAQNVAGAAAVPGSVGAGYPGQQAVPGAVPDMTALLAQGLGQPNALLAMLAAAQQNQVVYGLNPAVLASLNPAAIAAAFGGAGQTIPSAPGVQPAAAPVANQGSGGMGSVGYQQNVGGFQGLPGFQGPPGFQVPAGYQNAQQVGTHQGGAGNSYQGGLMGQAQSMPPAGQMGGYGPH